jgi:ketosteroid isomerase-like protein
MAEHANVALVRRAMEAMSVIDPSNPGEQMAILDAFFADDIVWHEIGRAEPRRGKDALRASMAEAGPDVRITYDVHDVVANDEHAIVLGTAHATRGDRTLEYRTAEIYHIRNGQAAERWAFSDDTAAIVEFFG